MPPSDQPGPEAPLRAAIPGLSGKRFRSGLWAWLAVMVASGALVLLGFELHLRRSAFHIAGEGAVIERNPELLVRHTARGRRLVPNARVVIHNHHLSRRDVPMHINSLGFRGEELPEPKPPGEWRVLVLGDSITWADYLPVEESFVARAEAELRSGAHGEAGRRARLVNAGVGDVGLREELDILEESGLGVHPDAVVVAFYLNDSRPSWGFEGEAGHRGWLRRNSLVADRIYQGLLLRRWIRQTGEHRFGWIAALDGAQWANDRERFLQVAELARHDWGAAWEAASWDGVSVEFDRLRLLSARHGWQVAVVALPVAMQVYASFLEAYPQEMLARTAQRLGFRYLDLLPLLRASHGFRNLYFDHCHPNAEANALIGSFLARFLARELAPGGGAHDVGQAAEGASPDAP